MKLPKIGTVKHDHYISQLRRNYLGTNLNPMQPSSIPNPLPLNQQSQNVVRTYENSILHKHNYANAYRPSKLRSLNYSNPHHIQAQGERIRLNQHGSQEKLSSYSQNYGSPERMEAYLDTNKYRAAGLRQNASLEKSQSKVQLSRQIYTNSGLDAIIE